VTEQGTSVSHSTHPQSPSLGLPSESLHNCSRSEATESLPQRQPKALPANHFGQEGGSNTSRGGADGLELQVARSVLDIDLDDEERQQQVLERGEDKIRDGNDGLQQEMNNAAALSTSRIVDDSHPFDNEDGRSEPRHDEAGIPVNNDSDGELSKDSDSEEGRPLLLKRKQQPLSHNGPTSKKPKHLVQRRPLTRRAPSKSSRHSPKRRLRLDHGSRVTTTCSATGQLPSPLPSTSVTTNADLAYDWPSPSVSS
jgi:hypothetical protein